MKKVHHYNAETRVWTGSSEADPSPLEPGVYLVPAHATMVAPPVIPAGQQATFDGEDWTLDFIPGPPKPTLRELLKDAPRNGFGSMTIKQALEGEKT